MGEYQFDQETLSYAARVCEQNLGEDIEVFFDGTPAELSAAVTAVARRLTVRSGHYFHVSGGTSRPDDHLADLEFAALPLDSGYGRIIGHREPGGGTVVFVTSEKEVWPAVVRSWAVIFRELQRQGWMTADAELRKVSDTKCERSPTVRTQTRFEVMKRLKDQHPDWSQDKVAAEAGEELGEVIFGETVRNTYRSMGVDWPRADRVR